MAETRPKAIDARTSGLTNGATAAIAIGLRNQIRPMG